MGSLAVADTAHDMAHNISAPRKPLHPFFAPNRQCAPVSEPDTSEPEAPSLNDPSDDKPEENGPPKTRGRPRKRRKIETDIEDCEDRQEEPKKRRGRKPKPPVGANITSHFKKVAKEEDASPAGHAPEPVTTGSEAQDTGTVPGQAHQSGAILAEEGTVAVTGGQDGVTGGVQQADEKPTANTSTTADASAKPGNPQKTWFDPKKGRFSTLKPAQHPESIDSEEDMDEPSSRRRVKKLSKIVIVAYGQDDEPRLRIGKKINTILGASPAPSSSSSKGGKGGGSPKAGKASTPKKPTPKKPAPKAVSKATHPFFLAKGKASDNAPSDAPLAKKNDTLASPGLKLFTSTPKSPQKRRIAGTSTSTKAPLPFGARNATLKFSGSRHPAWPCKEAMHVRDNDNNNNNKDNGLLSNGGSGSSHGLGLRRAKGRAVKVGSPESILSALEVHLDIKDLVKKMANINTDNFLTAPPELRLPKKHLESGHKLQSRVLPELRTFRLPPTPAPKLAKARRGRPPANKTVLDDVDELPEQLHEANTKQPPPQLQRLFSQIQSGLSAFDRSTCETSNWTNKYAPDSAIEVLQDGEEAILLKKWLTAMIVQSVNTGSLPTGETTPKKAGRGRKKVRKSNKYLDEFIAYSDDDDFAPDDLTDDDEAAWGPSGVNGVLKKTVVRRSDHFTQGKQSQRLSNGLVISGPHGCGKTAAVYAVAKELDFEIFELNPGSRRSGKDITDKIGDMTRNHLVHHHKHVASAVEDDTSTAAAADEDTAAEVKSGKQATMNAFFKIKADAKAGSARAAQLKKPVQGAATGVATPPKQIKKEPPQNKKQSLILLEEVDVLYEEDRQFWNTVIYLMLHSKRPFIMTCNDESLIPLRNLDLHGIFRLGPPPRDLAVDRLLLIAANEGHALSRSAVELLFESRHRDLRAATTDLQFWCQFGIGDGRGGFSWFFPRLPKGIDLNEDGEVVRVVSEGTYCNGMEKLARDGIIQAGPAPLSVEEELRQQSWESWQLDLARWQLSMGLESWADDLGAIVSDAEGCFATLEAYEHLAESISTADVCSCGTFSTTEVVDATLPALSSKAREDIVQGRAWLDTPLAPHRDNLAVALPTSISTLARSSLVAETERLFERHGQTTARLGHGTLSPPAETETLAQIQASFTTPAPDEAAVCRFDFALAFDCIAADSAPGAYTPTSYLDPSVFDRTLRLISHDVAPFVRGIIAHERRMHERRQRMVRGSLLGSCSGDGDGATKKRARSTRSARSALEGGSRSEGLRAERPWFRAELNPHLVMRTAGKGWDDAAWAVICGDGKGRQKDGKALGEANGGELGGETSDELNA